MCNTEGQDGGAIVFGIILLLAVITSCGLVIAWNNWYDGYMEGQIDCLNSKCSVELQKKEDGSVKWVATQPAFHKWSDAKRFQVK